MSLRFTSVVSIVFVGRSNGAAKVSCIRLKTSGRGLEVSVLKYDGFARDGGSVQTVLIVLSHDLRSVRTRSLAGASVKVQSLLRSGSTGRSFPSLAHMLQQSCRWRLEQSGSSYSGGGGLR